MKYIDVFNGDADGLCALLQLRLEQPRQSELVTGIKREINLLSRVQAGADCHVTVLDISFKKNANDVARLLENGAVIDYFDHHQTGELISHENLQTNINLAADTCTSLIVDQQLKGKYRAWALTAAFGDNLVDTAMKLGLESGFSDKQLLSFKELGIYLNYNGYGASTDDLFFHPATLFEKIQPYSTPFEFLANDAATFETLASGYQQDMALAQQAPLIHETDYVAVIQFPDEMWARRVSGVFGNELANLHPDRAHAVITEKADGSYLVSVRAPLNRKYGADELVSQFPTGGGRKAAAGINQLPADMLGPFIDACEAQFSV
ncbi:MAG: acetyltransferase [Gammaproteobacteria bacterium]|nr:MAG: acetyltransferase [Gammaproteobacteria bacterium]